MGLKEDALALHKEHKGKLAVNSKVPLRTSHDLSLAYTPGVAEPCRKIAKNVDDVYKYTGKGNMVAVVTDGSAVLGLGNIGPEAALPVMEGKAAIFKEFAGIDAFPICFATQDVQKNIEAVRCIAPVFGGINLEDYKAPECFEIEAALQDLGIPVMHDDQHGTAVSVLAALINSLHLVKKKKEHIKVVISGAGAAAMAIAKLLLNHGVACEHMLLCDSRGILYHGREDIVTNKYKQEIALLTNTHRHDGDLAAAMKDADVFIGVSKGGLVSASMVKAMKKDAIVIAMANPDPEILPDAAKKAGAAIVATGRSDFPNQVNNALVFPGVFRGALDCKATQITDEMKLAAAHALAGVVDEPSVDEILPHITDREVVARVSEAVQKAWKARKKK